MKRRSCSGSGEEEQPPPIRFSPRRIYRTIKTPLAYHSKYNPIERVWRVLEKHWMGELLQSINKVLGLARTMTFRAVAPLVELVTKTYEKAVKVAASEMATINARIDRLSGLESWFITIVPQPILG